MFFYSAWIEVGCLKPYFQFKETLTYSCKSSHFKEAVKAIEQFIEEDGTKRVSIFIKLLFYYYFN